MISNFSYSVVPITNESKITSKLFIDLESAIKHAKAYSSKKSSNYAKIISITTNNLLYESKK